MPTSIVVELHARELIFGKKVRFFSGTEGTCVFEMPVEMWNDLSEPDKLRVRIEDAWNDPDRKW